MHVGDWVFRSLILFLLFMVSLVYWESFHAAQLDSLPPLLRGLDAAADMAADAADAGQICPPLELEAASGPSYKLGSRLRRDFPPGFPENDLVTELAKQGFNKPSSCGEDLSVRQARFVQQHDDLFVPTMSAAVVWKVNQSGNIVWTRGDVFFSGSD